MADPFIAEIRMFGGTFAPRNWTFCEGQLLSISQYTTVFALVDTMYGGDGRTNFGIPNMKGRAPMHTGTGTGLTYRPQGYMGGYPTVTLNENNLSPHTHQLNATSADGTVGTTEGNMLSQATKTVGRRLRAMLAYNSPNPSSETAMAPEAISKVGNSQPHENRQPFLGINFIFSLDGIFPSRS